MLALCVEGGSRLIKEKNLRLADEGASNCDTLLLATRELDTTLSNECFKAQREYGLVLNKFERVCFLASGLYVSVGNIFQAIGDVLADGASEKNGLLRNDSDLPLVPAAVKILDIDT